MLKALEKLKQLTSVNEAAMQSKEQEVRSLQTSMGEMVNQDERLKDQNKSKQPSKMLGPIACFYFDTRDKAPSARDSVDLNKEPPSEKLIEGALVIMTTMFAAPVTAPVTAPWILRGHYSDKLSYSKTDYPVLGRCAFFTVIRTQPF
jgi:hypothetical protein